MTRSREASSILTSRRSNDDHARAAVPATKPEPASGSGGANLTTMTIGPSPFGGFRIVILVILVVGGLLVMFELRDVSNVQDCVQSGREELRADR